MNCSRKPSKTGFTLLETVISIGVLAVLLSGFVVVFAPAAAGIRRAISSQEASRLVTTVELELVTLRGDVQAAEYTTGFGKAFKYIEESDTATTALIVYKYRGYLSDIRDDGTAEPVTNAENLIPGEDFMVQAMVRRKDDPLFAEDIPAMEGAVYIVKCTQLVMKSDSGGDSTLQAGGAGQIVNPDLPDDGPVELADNYPHAVISFVADFYSLPSRSAGFFANGFDERFTQVKNPVFSRNLAIRR